MLSELPVQGDSRLLVGFDKRDDAGVYKVSEEIALVTTADFITPPVDDAVLFGEIAAANALSDVYAMGGRPVTCVNIVCFPSKKLPIEDLQGIIRGALVKISESGAVMVGGHTVDDEEPKFGLAVTGLVHPDRIWRNSRAQVGDALLLTKPIGGGVLLNANLKGLVSSVALDACLNSMRELNARAAEILADYPVHAVTDVTGFGLAGHALEMCEGSGVAFEIEYSEVPKMPEALQMYQKGISTGSNNPNRLAVGNKIEFGSEVKSSMAEIFFDPQTSGGLLAAVAPEAAAEIIERMLGEGITDAKQIGRVGPSSGKSMIRII